MRCTRGSKSDWHYRFGTEEQRIRRIQAFFASLDAQTQRVAERRQQRTQHHTLTVGDVVYNSWGYDQTNIDFTKSSRLPQILFGSSHSPAT